MSAHVRMLFCVSESMFAREGGDDSIVLYLVSGVVDSSTNRMHLIRTPEAC